MNKVDPSLILFRDITEVVGTSGLDGNDVMTALTAACCMVALSCCDNDEKKARALVKKHMTNLVLSAFPAVVALMQASEDIEALMQAQKATKQ